MCIFAFKTNQNMLLTIYKNNYSKTLDNKCYFTQNKWKKSYSTFRITQMWITYDSLLSF